MALNANQAAYLKQLGKADAQLNPAERGQLAKLATAPAQTIEAFASSNADRIYAARAGAAS